MKTPSRSIPDSLRGQSGKGRAPATVEMGRLRPAEPAMIVPGDGNPGPAVGRGRGLSDNRSSAIFADANSRVVGKG